AGGNTWEDVSWCRSCGGWRCTGSSAASPSGAGRSRRRERAVPPPQPSGTTTSERMHLLIAGHPVPVMAVLGLGLVVGFLAGLFGVGGGFLLTPLLNVVLGIPLDVAVGSGLCQMIGTATTALLRHRRLGQGETRIDLLLLGGTLIGVATGARLMESLQRLG